ncbi:hypothetical protein MLD38_017977 [Melastoma candidum]|uniref:Uncharacterized protein n=1 Tax=Melastoma candidum TaxID=119954 RepID=A0ACB9QSF1_9MYRT|nr:hypothetical protein MLD38_017977 [Melastoma candidum]
MGVVSYESQHTTSIPPHKLFKAFILDADNLIPKVLPTAFKSIEILEGNGGPGTIKVITFGEGTLYKTTKHRVDALDETSLTYSYSIIEGDVLSTVLEKVTNDVKIEAGPDGGSLIKTTSKYYTIGDAEISQEQIKSGKERASALFKAIEAYVLAHPDEY